MQCGGRSLAASGGYFVAMAGSPLFVERTTMTGSIGVYAALANIAGLDEKIGFKINLIKQGEIKGYASALNDIGVKPAEVPTLATAWAEGKQLAQESMTKAMDNVPA